MEHIKIYQVLEVAGCSRGLITVTQISGYQVLHINGQEIPVDRITYTDYGDYCTQDYSRAMEPASPETVEANRRRVRELATKCLIDQGIW